MSSKPNFNDIYPIVPYRSNDIIEHIETNSKFYGGSSLRIENQCYMTNKVHKNSDDLISKRLNGTRRPYPYNSINIHKSTEWMFKCMKLNHVIINNILPYNCSTVAVNLPTKINIERSNGLIYEGCFNSDYGIRIGHNNNENELMFTVHFDNNKRKIVEPETVRDYLELHKDISFEKIKEQNNSLTEISVVVDNFSDKELENAKNEDETGVKCEVMEYFNKKMQKWIDTKEFYREILDINIMLN